MDKRYQVFLSSTFMDLMEERSLVMDTLYKHKCLPVGMENFPSLTIDSLPYIYRLIDESDFFLLILNGVYGSSKDAEGKSFTHLEWLHALEMGKPIIVLYRLDWKAHTKIDEDPDDATAFTKFFNEVKARHDGAKPWQPNTLAAMVIEAIDQAIIHHPEAVGWVRANKTTQHDESPSYQTPPVTIEQSKNIADNKLENIRRRLQDKVTLNVQCVYSSLHRSDKTIKHSFDCTWEEVFLLFAHYIMSPQEQYECYRKMEETLKDKFGEQFKKYSPSPYYHLDHIELDENTENDIRMEFQTNKLVSYKVMGPAATYWSISDLGEKYLEALHEHTHHPDSI